MRFPQSAEAQAERALDIIEAALRQVPAGLADIVRVRVYAPERDDVPAISGVLKRRLGAARATNTTVCCPLAVEGAKVEIEVTARRRTVGGCSVGLGRDCGPNVPARPTGEMHRSFACMSR